MEGMTVDNRSHVPVKEAVRVENGSNSLGKMKATKEQKILKKIVPKENSEFKSSSIQTVDSPVEKKSEGSHQTVDLTNSSHSYQKNYCRRKNQKSEETKTWFEMMMADDAVIENQKKIRGGVEVCGDVEDDVLIDVDEGASIDDCASYALDSTFSINSEESVQFQELDLGLKGLFDQSPLESTKPEHDPQVIENPFVGKVSPGFKFSFFNHSFKLHSLLPASFSVLGLSCGFSGEGGLKRVGGESGDREIFSRDGDGNRE